MTGARRGATISAATVAHDIAPLRALRLRTPRLELRLGSEQELRALAEVAERGVHPPEEMPFSVPWTDSVGEDGWRDGFCDYHAQQLASVSPEEWHLPFLVWCGGELVGEQSVFGHMFASTREISTGSWVGIHHQRHGIGTEMRTAVLELGFRGLGAEAATSAWLDGNDASRRVSEKLGYAEFDTEPQSPRGEPVTAHLMRIERGRWRPPHPVEIVGLEPAALALLGAAPG